MGTPEAAGWIWICSNSSTLKVPRHRALIHLIRQLILPSRQAKNSPMTSFRARAQSPASEVGFRVSFQVKSFHV